MNLKELNALKNLMSYSLHGVPQEDKDALNGLIEKAADTDTICVDKECLMQALTAAYYQGHKSGIAVVRKGSSQTHTETMVILEELANSMTNKKSELTLRLGAIK